MPSLGGDWTLSGDAVTGRGGAVAVRGRLRYTVQRSIAESKFSQERLGERMSDANLQSSSGLAGFNTDRGFVQAFSRVTEGGYIRPLVFKRISTAGTNAQALTNPTTDAERRITGIYASNTGATWAYLKFYSGGGVPNVGVAVPVFTIGIPPGGRADVSNDRGIGFWPTGFGTAITGGPDDTDATAILAGQVVTLICYL